MTNSAVDKKQFIAVWTDHINSLGRLRYPFMGANDHATDKELSDTIERLKAIAEKAGSLEFDKIDLIKLTKSRNSWLAHFSGPHAKRIERIFNTTVLPTGFTSQADSTMVMVEIKKRHPGVRVELAGF